MDRPCPTPNTPRARLATRPGRRPAATPAARLPTPSSSAPSPRRGADHWFAHVLDVTLTELRESLATAMPPGALRDYWLWGLDPATPYHASFVQAIGARQLCRLTATLLDGLVDDADWPVLLRYIGTMNVYQIYEIVSDNLGIGMLRPDGAVDPAQRQVLHGFNAAMVSALDGSPVDFADLLASVRQAASRLSGFTYSLAGPAHARMAAAFAAERRRHSVADIEYGLWPALVANVGSGVDVVDRLATRHIEGDLRAGLINRYAAVSRTLSEHHLPLFELATVGSHAILVAPTLAYYTGVLGEVLNPDPAFAASVVNGTLPEALYDAALLVRLLNDVGPGLLLGTPDERLAALRGLERALAERPGHHGDLRTLLLDGALASTVLTRLRKDLEHHEFNIALYGLRGITSVAQALEALCSVLDYLATLHALHADRLSAALSALEARLRDPRPLQLISRFVRFHRDLYAHPYHAPDGEYAV
jgi:hypothetical protein